jgi:hypothetical protein
MAKKATAKRSLKKFDPCQQFRDQLMAVEAKILEDLKLLQSGDLKTNERVRILAELERLNLRQQEVTLKLIKCERLHPKHGKKVVAKKASTTRSADPCKPQRDRFQSLQAQILSKLDDLNGPDLTSAGLARVLRELEALQLRRPEVVRLLLECEAKHPPGSAKKKVAAKKRKT